jgi:site-specific recombinase XerD
MTKAQSSLFDDRSYRGTRPPAQAIAPPTASQTVSATLPAYRAYLNSGGYSQYTPDDFTGDLKRFGQFTAGKPLGDIQTVDIQQWIEQLKQTMPPKTVSRKVTALRNYFRWLLAERVLARDPASSIHPQRVTSPLPTLLYDSECDRLLAAASSDPRTYLLVTLLLETGIKKAELLELHVGDFDFSNKYQPELWLRHSGKQVFKDRRLKLPSEICGVFEEYVDSAGVTDLLFPCTPRLLEQLLTAAARRAGLTKHVTAGILRDMFVVRSVRRGMKLEDALQKLALSKQGFKDAHKKYARLTSEAL